MVPKSLDGKKIMHVQFLNVCNLYLPPCLTKVATINWTNIFTEEEQNRFHVTKNY